MTDEQKEALAFATSVLFWSRFGAMWRAIGNEYSMRIRTAPTKYDYRRNPYYNARNIIWAANQGDCDAHKVSK